MQAFFCGLLLFSRGRARALLAFLPLAATFPYKLIGSGTCADQPGLGLSEITSESDCQAIVAIDIWPFVDGWPTDVEPTRFTSGPALGRPGKCFWHEGNQLVHWNTRLINVRCFNCDATVSAHA